MIPSSLRLHALTCTFDPIPSHALICTCYSCRILYWKSPFNFPVPDTISFCSRHVTRQCVCITCIVLRNCRELWKFEIATPGRWAYKFFMRWYFIVNIFTLRMHVRARKIHRLFAPAFLDASLSVSLLPRVAEKRSESNISKFHFY